MKACAKHGCGFFGSGGFIYFEIEEGQENYEFSELVPMLLLGVMGGLLGSSFISLNAKLTVGGGGWRLVGLRLVGLRLVGWWLVGG